jgi:drug/metabolite transporter (DMT)-like permease
MMNNPSIGFVSAIIAALIMGSIGVLIRHVSVDGSIIAFSRFALGFLFLTFFLLLSKRWGAFNVKISPALFFSGVFLALGVLSYISAIKTTTLANAVFLLYLAPLIASVLGHFLLQEKISAFKALLIILAFVGSLCLLEFNFSLGKTDISGQLFGFAAAFCYAFFIITNRKIAPEISGFSRAFYQLLFACLTLLPFVIGKIDLPSLRYDGMWLLTIGFFHGFIALTLMILSLCYLQSYEYATVSYLEPIIAAIIGYLIYNEALSSLQFSGGVLILACGFMQIVASIQSVKRET